MQTLPAMMAPPRLNPRPLTLAIMLPLLLVNNRNQTAKALAAVVGVR